VGTFNFLVTGGDNFRVFTQGNNAKDSGLVDRDAWIKYLGAQSATTAIAPDFARRGVEVVGAPATVKEGQQVTLGLAKLDLSSLGVSKSTKVGVRYEPSGLGGGRGFAVLTAQALPAELGTATVTNGAATLSFTVPQQLNGGSLIITTDGGTYSRLPITIPVTGVEITPPPTSTESSPAGNTQGGSPAGSGTAGTTAVAQEGTLATTGSAALPLGIGALVLLGAGMAVAVAARRKEANR